jgi:hypothetical protein
MAQRFLGHRTRVDAVDEDAAMLRRVNTLQQIDERRLAGARRADNGNGLAGLTSNDTSSMPWPEFGEFEADILEADMAGDVVELAQALRLGGVAAESSRR